MCSYDLDLDTRLSEETTVLVESYTVRLSICITPSTVADYQNYSYPTAESSRSVQNASKLLSACSSHTSSTSSSPVLRVRSPLSLYTHTLLTRWCRNAVPDDPERSR